MEDFPHPFDIEDMIVVARAAGRAIMEVYGKQEDDWNVQSKSDESPVTAADLKANKVICDALLDKYPSVPITSEENKKVPYSERKHYHYSWNIDPLDGTKEFIKRNGQFATNIALVKGQEPVCGLVHIPCTGQTYWAIKGRGSYVRGPEEDAQDVKLVCKEFSEQDEGLILIQSRRHKSKEAKDFVSKFKNPKFIQMGSSLKFTKIAENEAHIYPRLAPTCEWDTAAPHVVVTEAGGEIVHAGWCTADGEALEPLKDALEKNLPVLYNKENDLNPFFIAYGKRKKTS